MISYMHIAQMALKCTFSRAKFKKIGESTDPLQNPPLVGDTIRFPPTTALLKLQPLNL